MINLNKKRMNVIETAGNGVVNHQTIFSFRQNKDRVYARYSGGLVKRGMLVGKIKMDRLTFNYTQEHQDGQLAGGTSTCIISQTNGKLSLVENFNWDQGIGKNVFAELDE